MNNLQVFDNENLNAHIRVIEIDGQPHFVAKDVCEALEIGNPSQAITRLDEDEKNTIILNEGTSGNPTKTVVNEYGLYNLILGSRKPEAKQFKRWITHEVLPTIRKTGTYTIQRRTPIADAVSDIGAVAESIQSVFTVQRGIALSQAIDIVGINHNLKLDALKRLLPPADHETGYMNATQLGKKIGLTAQKTNKLLQQKQLQRKDCKVWRLTDEGAKYAEEMPYTTDEHSGYQIRWSDAVIDVLNYNPNKNVINLFNENN